VNNVLFYQERFSETVSPLAPYIRLIPAEENKKKDPGTKMTGSQ